MDFISFLKKQAAVRKPRIEAPLTGLWRLESSIRIDVSAPRQTVYLREAAACEDYYIDFGLDIAASYADCPLYPSRSPRRPHAQEYTPFEFDPRSGMLRHDGNFQRVERLDACTLVLCDYAALGMGAVVRSRYCRME